MVQQEEVKKRGRIPTLVKWVFKIKIEHNGSLRYKARVVVRGFSQIPGIDYTESFSPVASKTAIHVMIGIALFFEWAVEMFDVEAAFLNAKSVNETFIEWPDGSVEIGFVDEQTVQEYCILLVNSMYGTVDAAILWMKDIGKYLKKIGMTESKADPCIFYLHQEGKLVLVVAVNVNDTLLAGADEAKAWL